MVADIASKVFTPGGNGHMFRYESQFYFWVKGLGRIKETVADFREDPSGRAKLDFPVFTIEKNPLTYVRTPGLYW